MRRYRSIGAALGLLVVTACEALLVEPASEPEDAEISLAVGAAAAPTFGDLSASLASIRYVRFRIVREDAFRDTVVAARVDDGSVGLRLTLLPEEARGWVEIEAELLNESHDVMFRGRGLLHAFDVAPSATIQILPVAHHLSLPIGLTPSALLDTIQLGGQAVFANGAVIYGASLEWGILDSSIAEIVEGSRLVTRSNGSTTVTASAFGASRQMQVSVRQQPVVFTGVGPADTILSAGATFRARPFGEDRNGLPLLPGAAVLWSARGTVTVDAQGIVTAQSPGVGFVDATVGTVTHSAEVTVTP